MKNIFCVILLILLSVKNDLRGQTEYSFIDNFSKSVPDSIFNYKEIAYHLTKNFIKKEEKIRSLYIWITHNIGYDLEKYRALSEREDEETDLAKVIKNRKGICQDYSELFDAMSQSVGIESYVISGLTRQPSGELSSEGHAWNGVRIDTNYYLLDLTWSAGYVDNGDYYHEFRDKYFLKNPKEMIRSHLPDDPIWQFLDNPILLEEYLNEDFEKLQEKGNWNCADSISINKNLGVIEQLKRSNERIKGFTSIGSTKELMKWVQNKLDYNRYNLAIEYLRVGINNYNKYVNFRNTKFKKPKIDDSELETIISEAKYGIVEADKILDGFNTEDENLKELITNAN